MFIVYLKNAEAARVAQTLRALMTGGGDAARRRRRARRRRSATRWARPRPRRRAAGTPASAPPPSTRQPVRRRLPAERRRAARRPHDPGRRREQRADHHGARAAVQQPARDHRAARRAPRAGVRRGADRRGRRGQGRRVRHPVADPAGHQQEQRAGLRRHQLRHARSSRQNNIITGSLNLGALGQGLNAGIINGTVTIPGLGTITNLAFLARALEQDAGANILSTPTLLTLDNEEARIIVGQNVPIVTGQYATTGSTSTVQPFQTIERKDIGVMLRVKPQITEGGTIRLLVYQEVSRIESFTTTHRARAVEARARVVGGRRRPAGRGAGRPHPGQLLGRLRSRARHRRPADHRCALPLRRAQAAEGEPADLPQAHRRAHRLAGRRRSRTSATTTS